MMTISTLIQHDSTGRFRQVMILVLHHYKWKNMKIYKHVSYLWDEKKAAQITNEVDLFIYRSNLLGGRPSTH